jgi:hypothetical protein
MVKAGKRGSGIHRTSSGEKKATRATSWVVAPDGQASKPVRQDERRSAAPEQSLGGHPLFGVPAQGTAGNFVANPGSTGVAARGWAAGEVPAAVPYDPARMDWQNQSGWDAAAQIAVSQRLQAKAALLSTTAEMVPTAAEMIPPLVVPQEMSPQPQPVLRSGVAEPLELVIGGRAKPVPVLASVAPDHAIARRLSSDPTAIRDAARALALQVTQQIDEIRKWRPNDATRLAAHNQLVEFLEKLIAELTNLADVLDQAILRGTTEQPEPVFLGTAGKIAKWLQVALLKWVDENDTMIIDVSARVALYSTSVTVMHLTGADTNPAIGGLAALLFPRRRQGKETERGSKKRASK